VSDLDSTRIVPDASSDGAAPNGASPNGASSDGASRDGASPDGHRPRGGTLLAQISNAMVRIHKEHWGKGPTKARTIYAEDVVLTRLEEIFTRAETTLLRAGREKEVRNMRLAFQRELEPEFVAAVEHLTGRKVQAFISEIHAPTNMGVELFMLEPTGSAADPSANTPRDGE
jgi:uncharacterized protein YbcI